MKDSELGCLHTAMGLKWGFKRLICDCFDAIAS